MKKKFNKSMIGAIAVLTAFSMMALGSGSSSSDNSSDTQSKSVSVKEDANTDTDTDTNTTAEDKGGAVVDFEAITVVDNDECTIIISELDADNIWGYSVKTDIENKSADKTYMFSVESGAINGVSVDPFFAAEVAAGKKSKDTISFSDSQLNEYGVGEVTDIELTFRVYDSNDWTADPVAKETVHVYPLGEDKATTFVREAQDSDVVLVDNDQVKVVVIGTEDDSIWGFTVKLYMENKTDHSVMFSVDEASVNGYMADPFWATSVNANKMGFGSMSWGTSSLEEIGISDSSEISEIEFKLRAYNDDDYSANDIVNDTFTLELK